VSERLETSRLVSAPTSEIFALLCDPQGHVAIDASGMLQDATGEPVSAVGDSFVVHMDREALGDLPDWGRYDVTVRIEELEPDRLITWSILGRIRPQIGHRYGYRLEPADEGTLVTSVYDWSEARQDFKDNGVFPVISEANLRATLGILDRTVRRGYPLAAAGA
jgi:carbon monoxide dehydrogenase subunit G